MSLRRVSPAQAAALLDEGYVYLDVRSVPEFEAGHPRGAYNVPLAHLGPGGMTPNHDFLALVERHFPRQTRLVVGCKSGGRSLQAAALLLGAGYTDVVDQHCGYDGAPGPHGFEAGWRAAGLPTAQRAEPGRSYADLKGGAA
jgi:rhodanese-related sulfurtransferase